MSLDYWLKY